MKNLKFYYKLDNKGIPISGSLAKFAFKPKQGFWKELEIQKACCDPLPICSTPVQFRCITNDFYVEFINPTTGAVIGFYSNDNVNFQESIPIGTYDIIFYSVPNGQNVYINGVSVGVGDGGDITLEDYDTSTITSIGFCPQETMNVTINFLYNQSICAAGPRTNEQVAERVTVRIYSEDNTLLAETTLGGAATQILTIPSGLVQMCLFVDSYEADYMSSFAISNSSSVSFAATFSTGETCQGSTALVTSTYDVIASFGPCGD